MDTVDDAKGNRILAMLDKGRSVKEVAHANDVAAQTVYRERRKRRGALRAAETT